MKSRGTRKLPAFLWVLGLLLPRPILAAKACPSVAVEADAGVLDRWPGLPDQVHEAFAGRRDIDACAQVALAWQGSSVSVAVKLPDGRTAARSVSREEDVLPTVEALLILPEPEAAGVIPVPPETGEPVLAPPRAQPTIPRSATNPRIVPAGARAALADRGAANRPLANPSRPLKVELSLAAGGRMGDGQTSAGVAAFSFLDLEGWLAGFEGRLDRYQKLGGGSEAATLELAALGGRRLRFSTLALDFTAGPALVLQGTATSVTETSPNGRRISESSSSTVLRLLGGVRLNFSTHSPVRTFVGIDGEVGPERARGAELPRDAPRLPLWTVGLTLGATVGTP